MLKLLIIASLISVHSTTCIDGDSIKCKDSAGNPYTVRLIGLDSPERKQPFGKEAQEALTKLTLNKETVLQTFGKDKYGRTLGILHRVITPTFYVDVNAVMVRRGYAWNYGSKRYDYQEWLARRDKLGLWKQENPERPSDYRKRIKNAKQKS